MFQTIIISIVLFLFFILVLKIKIEIIFDGNLYVYIYLFKYIKLKKFKINKEELKFFGKGSGKTAKEDILNYFKDIEVSHLKSFIININKTLDKSKIDKLDFNLNINFQDYILNAYILTLINTIVAMIITKNINNINTKNLKYNITSNEKKIKFNLKCILYARFTNIIVVLIKVIKYTFVLKKRGNDKNGKGTSNRKFNGNSNVIVRSND